MKNTERLVLSPDHYLSRQSFGFGQPDNILSFQTMQNLANYTRKLYQSPSEPTYYSAY